MTSMFLSRSETEITANSVLEALANPHDRKILALTQKSPIEAQTIIEQTDIPKSTVYRRLRRLEDEGLLETVDARLRNGHAIDRYQARIEGATLRIDGGEIRADWSVRSGDEIAQPTDDSPIADEDPLAVTNPPAAADPAVLG